MPLVHFEGGTVVQGLLEGAALVIVAVPPCSNSVTTEKKPVDPVMKEAVAKAIRQNARDEQKLPP